MAITKVGADVTATVTAGTPLDIDLPTLAENDIVIVAASSDGDIDGSGEGVTTTGYTKLSGTGGSTPGFYDAWKRMGATPDTIVSFTTDSANDAFVVIQCWRGVDTTDAIDAAATGASNTTGMPDPPSYTTVTDGALRIIIGHLDDDLPTDITAPTDYTNLVTHGVATKGVVMMASKIWATAGAEDPAAFTATGANTDAWQAYHFALRPAAGGGAPQDITGVLFTNTSSFGTNKVSHGLIGVHFSNANTFGSATVSVGAANITGVLFVDADTFGTNTIGRGAVGITGVKYTNNSTFGSSTVTSIYPITGSKVDNINTFGASTITSTVNITGVHFSNTNTFGTHTIASDAGGQTITHAHFSNTSSFGEATLTSLYNITAITFNNTNSFGSNTIEGGDIGVATDITHKIITRRLRIKGRR